MCVGFPGKVVTMDDDGDFGVVDIGGTRKRVVLMLIDEELNPGDYVLVHAGFAIHKIDEDLAKEKLGYLGELVGIEIH